MSPEQQEVQSTLCDIREMRRAIERVEKQGSGAMLSVSSLRLQRLILILMAGLVAGLTMFELVVQPSITDMVFVTHYSSILRYIGVITIFIFLAALAVVLYLMLWRAAQQQGESFDAYLSRHFAYLKSMSFVSDLFVKFAAVAVAILARRPDWVAPLLVICTGDYLVQGRFFVLPLRLGMVLGVVYLMLGTAILVWLSGVLIYAFVPFLVATLLSLGYVEYLLRKLKTSATDEG